MNLLDGETPPDERTEILNKWKDKPLEDLLKAKIESDLYIKTLEKQKDELREDYLKQREELLAKAKFEELIDRYENAPRDQVAITPAKEESPRIDPKQIEDLVEQKIRQSKISDIETRNATQVQQKLKERFGDKYLEIVKEQQSTLGLSAEDVNALAKKSPEAFFRIMDLNEKPKQEQFMTPPRSAQRNDSFAPKGQTVRDYAYYQELKKANPKLYLDPKIAVQMHNDVIAIGEDRFYQGQ